MLKSKCAMRRLDAVFFENNMATVAQVKKLASFTVSQGSPVEQCASIKPAGKTGEQIE